MPTNARIAIIEDNSDLLQSTLEYLSFAGYTVWGVASAEAFYKQFVVSPADIIIVDIGLPGEDGLSVASFLNGNPNLSVIIVSANNSVESKLAGLSTGADRYLTKPLDLAELAANIDALSRHEAILKGSAVNTVTPQLAPSSDAQLQPKEPGTAWLLSSRNWSLITPYGKQIQLTVREFGFLRQLFVTQGQPVAKRQLAETIFGTHPINSGERLTVLVARLRKKCLAATGEDLPLKTAHMIGYAFTAKTSLD